MQCCLMSGASFKENEVVDKFAENFGFGKPDFFSAIWGNIDASEFYCLDKEKFKEVFGEYFEEDE